MMIKHVCQAHCLFKELKESGISKHSLVESFKGRASLFKLRIMDVVKNVLYCHFLICLAKLNHLFFAYDYYYAKIYVSGAFLTSMES